MERSDGAGGCAQAFRRGAYVFDPAIAQLATGAEGELRDGILAHLGVRDRCTLVPLREAHGLAFPDLRMSVPFGADELAAAHTDLFPRESAAIHRYFELCEEILQGAHQLPLALSLEELGRAAEGFPSLFRYRTSTLAEVLDEHFGDPRLRAVCGGLWPYVGLPPSRASFFTFAQLVAVTSRGGLHCQGGFGRLAEAFVASLESLGSQVLLGREVTRILIEDGAAAGVELADGERLAAPVVVSAADATQTLERLVGAEHLPAPFVRRLRRMSPSISGFVVFAATTLDIDPRQVAHETFLHPSFDHERSWDTVLAGVPGGAWVTVPTLLDPSLAPAGEHLVIVRALAPYDPDGEWDDLGERFAEHLLAQAETLLPGLREALSFAETAAPPALERHTGNREGALYGWEHSPSHTGSRRLGQDTPLPGLYLCGHWTQPGAGGYRAILSGMHAARAILARAGEPEAIPEFRRLGEG